MELPASMEQSILSGLKSAMLSVCSPQTSVCIHTYKVTPDNSENPRAQKYEGPNEEETKHFNLYDGRRLQ